MSVKSLGIPPNPLGFVSGVKATIEQNFACCVKPDFAGRSPVARSTAKASTQDRKGYFLGQ